MVRIPTRQPTFRTAAVDGTPDMEVHSKERDVRN